MSVTTCNLFPPQSQREADRQARERQRAAFRREVQAREKVEKEQEELRAK